MPSRDPKTGKPVGGAAKARKKKVQAEAERKRKKGAGGISLEPPPKNNADLVSYAARGLANAAFRASQDRSIFLTELDQLRFLTDTFAKIGLVRDKMAEQERIRESLKQGAEDKGTAGLESVGPPPPTIPRPDC